MNKEVNWKTIILIGLAGSLIANFILLYGFFAMQREVFNQIKQYRNSLNQIEQLRRR